jgi:hypothetical protein
MIVAAWAITLLLALDGPARALDRFEIQVYDGTANAPGQPSVELHANGVVSGADEGHLTLEPAFGVTRFWEAGAYLLTAITADGQYEFAGAKLRSKLVAPDAPLRLGCNFEVSYVRPPFDIERWGAEVRPIVGWDGPRWGIWANPIVDVSFSGAPSLEPAAMALVKVAGVASLGLEYYGDFGPVNHLGAGQQYLFEVANLLAMRNLELNAGVGEGLTAASNALVIKLIFGYAYQR